MPNSGQVTIISRRLYKHYSTSVQCLTLDVMTITVAPEQTNLSAVSATDVFIDKDNEKLRLAYASIKKKTYKDVKYNDEYEARRAARADFESVARQSASTIVDFGKNGEYRFPIPHRDMQKAFAVARAGYDVTISSDDNLKVEITAQSLASVAQSILRPKTKCKMA